MHPEHHDPASQFASGYRFSRASDKRVSIVVALAAIGTATLIVLSAMRLSSGLEGHISNFERTIDGYLAGHPYEQLLPALELVNVYPFEQPVLDLGF